MRAPGFKASNTAEAAAMLRWVADDNFTFLGYREYSVDDVDGDKDRDEALLAEDPPVLEVGVGDFTNAGPVDVHESDVVLAGDG